MSESDATNQGGGAPAPVPGDDKDWTWVLERVCPECEVDVRSFPREEVGDRLRANAEAWVSLLAGDPDVVRTRTEPTRWSVLEYACHVSDVFDLYDYRLDLMLTEDGPSYPNWDQDETAIEKKYHLADPVLVSGELTAAAERLATSFENVSGDQWSRTGYRSDGAEFTVESFARYFLHDPLHHLWDVQSADR